MNSLEIEVLRKATQDVVSMLVDIEKDLEKKELEYLLYAEKNGRKRDEVMNTLGRCIRRKEFNEEKATRQAVADQVPTIENKNLK